MACLARSESAAERVESLGARVVRGDLSDTGAMTDGMEGSGWVFHCAAFVGSWGDPKLVHRVNVDGTSNVIAAAQQAGARRLVHLSTESVLLDGRALDEINENVPIPQPGHLSAYAASKAEAEREVLAVNGPDLQTVAVRPRLI